MNKINDKINLKSLVEFLDEEFLTDGLKFYNNRLLASKQTMQRLIDNGSINFLANIGGLAYMFPGRNTICEREDLDDINDNPLSGIKKLQRLVLRDFKTNEELYSMRLNRGKEFKDFILWIIWIEKDHETKRKLPVLTYPLMED